MAMRLITSAAALTALMLAPAALAQQQEQAAQKVELLVAEKEPYGQYLTDSAGRSLYMFKADSERNSTCYDDCAEAWPPLLTTGEPVAGQGVDKSLIGTIEREGTEGAMQVVYNGWPLYHFARDQEPGDTEGQDIEGFGAEWYLLTPQGEEVHAEGEEEEA